jgi:excisionase family DNA binding protein
MSKANLSTRYTDEIRKLIERIIVEIKESDQPPPEVNQERKAPRLLTARDVAERLQTNTQAVYRLAREGKLPAVPLGERTLRWTEESVADFIETGGVKPESEPTHALRLAEANSKG